MLGSWLKTSILMAGIVVLFGMVGAALGGSEGMLIALLFAAGMNIYAYWFSDKIVLKMYNAREVDEASAPGFYRMIRELAQTAKLPMPKVYIIDEAQPMHLPPDVIRGTQQSPPRQVSCAFCQSGSCVA